MERGGKNHSPGDLYPGHVTCLWLEDVLETLKRLQDLRSQFLRYKRSPLRDYALSIIQKSLEGEPNNISGVTHMAPEDSKSILLTMYSSEPLLRPVINAYFCQHEERAGNSESRNLKRFIRGRRMPAVDPDDTPF